MPAEALEWSHQAQDRRAKLSARDRLLRSMTKRSSILSEDFSYYTGKNELVAFITIDDCHHRSEQIPMIGAIKHYYMMDARKWTKDSYVRLPRVKQGTPTHQFPPTEKVRQNHPRDSPQHFMFFDSSRNGRQ